MTPAGPYHHQRSSTTSFISPVCGPVIVFLRLARVLARRLGLFSSAACTSKRWRSAATLPLSPPSDSPSSAIFALAVEDKASRRALDRQEKNVDTLRTKSAALLSVASIVASFLGSRSVSRHHWGR